MNERDGQRFAVNQRARSFGYALGGIAFVLRTQHNAWIHAAISIAVVVLAAWLGVSLLEWAILFLAMLAVWVAEFVNTAVEATVDLITEDRQPLAEVAKDVAAGAVLLAAAGSVIVGLLVLGPPLWSRLVG
ncbi:MAG: diacylglycerol kinase family protein [Chloroflexota bacterium]